MASVDSASRPASAHASPSRYAGVVSRPMPARSPRNDDAREAVSPEKKPWLGHDCPKMRYVHEMRMRTTIARTEPDTKVSLGGVDPVV